jgi:hypothetical protein
MLISGRGLQFSGAPCSGKPGRVKDLAMRCESDRTRWRRCERLAYGLIDSFAPRATGVFSGRPNVSSFDLRRQRQIDNRSAWQIDLDRG